MSAVGGLVDIGEARHLWKISKLSLMSMFGMVALTGIVVNDSLVMVDFINKRRREGASLRDGVREGALQRLRPIVSTTLTTCLGLLPLAIGLGGQDLVLAPMALAITAGLGIATLLVLLVVPALYLVVEGIRMRVGGGTPTGGGEDEDEDEDAPADPSPSDGQTVPAPPTDTVAAPADATTKTQPAPPA